MTDERYLEQVRDKLREFKANRERNRIETYSPYPKQFEFHRLGAEKTERLLTAGNQLGKTLCGAHEAAFHATGRYPDWWPGRVWTRPTRGWVGGESSQVVRDTTQKLLLGDVTEGEDRLGTGIIPADDIVNVEWSRGVALGADTVVVKNKSGGKSVIKFKSYEMQRQKWQGDTIDWVWFDEEPPADIYSEGLARFTATDGMAFMTFTPLKGMSTVVKRFFNDDDPNRAIVKMTVYDAAHITEEGLKKLLSKYPIHEHDCRINGIPMQGEGRIFTLAESVISCEPFEIPTYWKHIIGLDLGHGQSERAHPTAAVWIAVDIDQDRLYIYRTYRVQGGSVPVHASALRAQGMIPVAWPHDAMAGDKFSGKTIAQHYKENGCDMLREHARWQDDGSISVAKGIVTLQELMETGRLKVFSTCTDWFEEYRNYHMEISDKTGESKIVALDDDLLSATRYAVMMKRFAKPVQRSVSWKPRQKEQKVASGMNFDIFTGR